MRTLFLCFVVSSLFMLSRPLISQESEQPITSFSDQVKSGVRPIFETLLGQSLSDQILGVGLDSIELPEIPKIVKNAKDASARRELNQTQLSQDQWQRYNITFISDLHRVVKKDQANRNDLAKWMNVLDQGGTHEGVYRAMVLDRSYAGLENYPNDVAQVVVDFTHWYMKKFNNRNFKKSDIEGVNFFSVKRIMTEHSLDTFDALAQQNARHAYRWYAVFSGELARRYPEAFRNELRANKMMRRHEQWASQMPEQLIKSELIMKLHLVFNFLQG